MPAEHVMASQIDIGIIEYLASRGDIETALEVSRMFELSRGIDIDGLHLAAEYKASVKESDFAGAKELIRKHSPEAFAANPEIAARLDLARVVHAVKHTDAKTDKVLELVRSEVVPSIEAVRPVSVREELSATLNECMKTCIIRSQRGSFPSDYECFVQATWDAVWPHIGLFTSVRLERIMHALKGE